jgi:orotate phosphoribosyltransferase
MAIAQARDTAEELRTLGLSVNGPTEPIEKRFDPMSVGVALAAIPMIVRMARVTVEDLDRIIEVFRKWANNRGKDQPKRTVQILGPDGKVIKEIESEGTRPSRH